MMAIEVVAFRLKLGHASVHDKRTIFDGRARMKDKDSSKDNAIRGVEHQTDPSIRGYLTVFRWSVDLDKGL